MTFADFKKYCKIKSKGDFVLPLDDEFSLITHESLKNIANISNVYPLQLITSDIKNYEVLRPLTNDLFVRVPEKPIENEDVLDIDEGLCFAVVYDLLEKHMSDVHKIAFEKSKILNNYNWNMFNLKKELANE